MQFGENPLQSQREKENKMAEGFNILHFYWSFSSNIMAGKGLTNQPTNQPTNQKNYDVVCVLCACVRACVCACVCVHAHAHACICVYVCIFSISSSLMLYL